MILTLCPYDPITVRACAYDTNAMPYDPITVRACAYDTNAMPLWPYHGTYLREP